MIFEQDVEEMVEFDGTTRCEYGNGHDEYRRRGIAGNLGVASWRAPSQPSGSSERALGLTRQTYHGRVTTVLAN